MVALEQRGLRDRRPAVQPRQPEADRRDPVRQARPAGRQEDARAARRRPTRSVLAEARRRLSAAGQAARASRPVEAEGHLHRQAAADGQPGDRPRAHALRAGGGGDRAALEQRSEPAEHPDPHGRGPAHPRGLHRAAGARRSCRPTTRRSSCASWPTSAGDAGPAARLRRRHRRAPRDRRRGLRRRRADEVIERAAALRQGRSTSA